MIPWLQRSTPFSDIKFSRSIFRLLRIRKLWCCNDDQLFFSHQLTYGGCSMNLVVINHLVTIISFTFLIIVLMFASLSIYQWIRLVLCLQFYHHQVIYRWINSQFNFSGWTLESMMIHPDNVSRSIPSSLTHYDMIRLFLPDWTPSTFFESSLELNVTIIVLHSFESSIES